MKKNKLLKTSLMASLLLAPLTFPLTGCDDNNLKITLEATEINEAKTVIPGQTIQLSAIVSDSEVGLPTYQIVEGSDYASVSSSGVLTIKETAVNGAVIKVVAKIGSSVSNELVFTVSVVAPTAITISTTEQDYNIERNQEVIINATVTPSDASITGITYSIIAGSNFATITQAGVLKVDADAPIGTIVKVQASIANLTSNVLEFTVIETPESEFSVLLTKGDIEIDSTSSQASYTLSPIAFDANGSMMEDATFTYQVMEGIQFVNVSSSGVITVIGHGQARVRATVVGSSAYAECNVTAIMPPKTIAFEEEYEGKTRYGFSYLKSDRSTPETLSFEVIGKGSTLNQIVANTFKYEFFLDDSEEADPTLATYNELTKSITFNQKASGHKVRIKVTSDTNASRETTRTFTVDVNDGYNVRSMDELASIGKNHNVDATINLVDDCILTDEDITESNPLSNYTLYFVHNFTLFGNGHVIDMSDVSIQYGKVAQADDAPTFLYIENDPNADINVNFYNLEIKGNVGVDASYDTNGQSPVTGGFSRGIQIRGVHVEEVENYLKGQATKPGHAIADIDDLKISGFRVGLRAEFLIESQISNITLENNHQSGMEITASIVTIKNINIGKNGTTGIELTPDNCDMAGVNFNSKQTITFEGKVNCLNPNDWHTQYINHDATLTALQTYMNAIIANQVSDANYQKLIYDDTQANNTMNWFLLIMNNPGSSNPNEKENATVVYFREEKGEYKDIKTDIYEKHLSSEQYTKIKFISVLVDVSQIDGLSAYGKVAKMILVNQLYQGD